MYRTPQSFTLQGTKHLMKNQQYHYQFKGVRYEEAIHVYPACKGCGKEMPYFSAVECKCAQVATERINSARAATQ